MRKIEYIINDKGCHICTSHKPESNGYVRVCVNRKRIGMHRYIYEQTFGKVCKSLVIRHKCDMRNCINIDHLEVGTQRENVNDAVKRNRINKGSDRPQSKLTEVTAKEIKYNDKLSLNALAKLYNVSKFMIYQIKHNKRWKHI